MEQSQKQTEQVTPVQICLLILSLAAIIGLLIDAVAPLPREVSKTVQTGDTIVCVLLFLDFINRFRKAGSKREFMRLGWIDLVACIPNVDFLRAGRLVRGLRIIRLVRGLRAGHRVIELFRPALTKGDPTPPVTSLL